MPNIKFQNNSIKSKNMPKASKKRGRNIAFDENQPHIIADEEKLNNQKLQVRHQNQHSALNFESRETYQSSTQDVQQAEEQINSLSEQPVENAAEERFFNTLADNLSNYLNDKDAAREFIMGQLDSYNKSK